MCAEELFDDVFALHQLQKFDSNGYAKRATFDNFCTCTICQGLAEIGNRNLQKLEIG